MLKGVHFLLTYKCTSRCDHCFVFGAPDAPGTFTLAQIRRALDDLTGLGTIEGVFFEGGEPFLFYPILLEGVSLAAQKGFKAGIVTNGYWATSPEDAEAWLAPLCQAGLSSLCVSDDPLHYGEQEPSPAQNALVAARALGVGVSELRTEPPSVGQGEGGEPAVTGGVMFRGRAAETLAPSLPTRPCGRFAECPHENLADPGRVHADAYGNVHLCQGLLMGNMWRTPFAELVAGYDPDAHPIVGPLLRGGPTALAEQYGVAHAVEYVDACQFCYEVRRALRDRFPECLGPPQVYGAPE
ncbi:MAG: hypothetical protein AMK73_06815 [Planctomycetes bacterium SM23_32]|nr:MAG: hypothetical protein AMK73_06815 [Planctomycetes bacterium SM23_32]